MENIRKLHAQNWCDWLKLRAHRIHLGIQRYHLPIGLLFICLLTLLIQTWAVRQQAHQLTQQQQALVYKATVASHERELEHAVDLARNVIGRLAIQNGAIDRLQQQALAILGQLELGRNGYFFVYDQYGRSLLQPEQMRLQGVDFCEPESTDGSWQAQQLLITSNNGGGFVRYPWRTPSTNHFSNKISYIAPVGYWGWSIGTGIYEDDIYKNIEAVYKKSNSSINSFFIKTLSIGILSIILISALAYGVHRHSLLNWQKKIKRLHGQIIQAENQTRQEIARDLHDGALQVMTSAKYLLEAAQCQPPHQGHQLIEHALTQLRDALSDIRLLAFSQQHSPQALKWGLQEALHKLLHNAQSCGLQTNACIDSRVNHLPQTLQTALYFIALEGISNAVTHAQGTHLELRVQQHAHHVQLEISDNGHGLSLAPPPSDRHHHGMGMNNIRQRVALLDGSCHWYSTLPGTTLQVRLPWKTS